MESDAIVRGMTREAKTAVRAWLERNPVAFEVIEDPKAPQKPVTLVERLSGKTLSFAWDALQNAEARQHPATRTTYYALTLDDGRAFAISSLGFIFAPSFASTGPLPDCPSAACFLDFHKLYRHLEHLAREDHEAQKSEALQVLFVLLAFLDGARAIGLDVSEEERLLEPILTRLESSR
jgi:hypothetical protein